MIAWWESLATLEQGLALIAIPSTVVLLIQTVLLVIGLGGGGAVEGGAEAPVDGGTPLDGGAPFDGGTPDAAGGGFDASAYDSDATNLVASEASGDPGLTVFTVRGFIAFFTVFGWSGLAMLRGGLNTTLSLTLAFWAGAISMLLTAYAFVWMLKLQHSGNVDIRNALNKTGNVYIRIPPGRKIGGKITMVLQGKFSEMEAVTDDEEEIKAGEEISIVGIAGSETLIVTKRKIKISETEEIDNEQH
ncbi:MAG: hypothetical protein FWE82_05150 [Defluviitaleaceae bacterium]|nr:hypothetical protein [Defluviitaleaceae bacterium]